MMGFGFGGIGMILFWIAIIAAVVVAIKLISGTTPHPAVHSPAPLDTLKRRYAAGEISKTEYDIRKRDLTGH